MMSQYQTLFLVCLICHIFRSLYEVLKYKYKISPSSKILFGFMFINMCALWASWFMMCELDPAKMTLSLWIRGLGLLLFILGIFLFVYTIFKMRAFDNYSGDLIQDGLFSITRHPMYLGFIFWLIGYSVFQQAQTTLYTSVVWVLNILFWRYIEEKQLERKHPNFKTYKEKTIF